jgi:hypothetical protein
MPRDERERNQLSKNPPAYWQQKLPGQGGVLNPVNLAMYSYAHQNPVRLKDPDGNQTLPPELESMMAQEWEHAYKPVLKAAATAYAVAVGIFAATVAALTPAVYVSATEIAYSGGALLAGATGTAVSNTNAINWSWGSSLARHFAKHGSEWTSATESAYANRAIQLLSTEVGGNIQGFTSKAGTVFRYNVRTNELAIGANGQVQTLFRPTRGLQYWLEQVKKFGE